MLEGKIREVYGECHCLKYALFFCLHLLLGYRLFVSTSGEQVLVVMATLELYLWEMCRQGAQWWKLFAPEGVQLPLQDHSETSIDAGFYVHQVHMKYLVCLALCLVAI